MYWEDRLTVPKALYSALFGILLTGCAADPRDELETLGGAEDGTGDGENEDGERFDLAPPVEVEPCSKVDLLFVIDDSTSMKDEQASLIAAFPGFVEDIESKLGSVDNYHVGIVTTDGYVHNAPGCKGLGDLVTQTGGPGSSEEKCDPFTSERRFIDESEPDLAAKFGCAAQVGTRGMPGEQQIGAILGAVNPIKGDFNSCNSGFIRDDALLVVVLISDEDDAESCYPEGCIGGTAGKPEQWFHELVALKGGVESNIVMLSIVGGPGAYWDCGVEEAPNIVEFTEQFTHGSVGDICNMDYAQYFGTAMEIVDDGCAGFRPQG